MQVVHDFAIKEMDVMDALLGEEAIVVDRNHEALTRLENGVWLSSKGPRHRNISAVLAWPTLDPWKFAAVEPIMVHNPYPARPLPNDAFPIAQYVFDDARSLLTKQDGSPIAEILGLDKHRMPED